MISFCSHILVVYWLWCHIQSWAYFTIIIICSGFINYFNKYLIILVDCLMINEGLNGTKRP